mmetsp:Transcript_23093/g.36897  ORF Transcript_23093/g.36897 Transcript_23093/m.36897 type:complete len:95 (-) Transcript_23093:334-618(-)
MSGRRCENRALHLPNRRKAQKYVNLEDLALECGCVINLSDTVESVKLRISSMKFCPVANIHFTIYGKSIPNGALLKDYLDMNTRFMLSWHSPIA